VSSVQKRGPKRYRARFRDADKKEHSQTFETKRDADAWVKAQATDVNRGDWINPVAGLVSFGDVAKLWQSSRLHRPTSAANVDSHLRNHILPTFGDRALSSILPSEIDAWVASKSTVLAPATLRTVFSYLSGVFRLAIRDERLKKSPCVDVVLPKIPRKQIVPLTIDEVRALADAMPERYGAMVLFVAQTGLRQGEAFGLTVDRVKFLQKTARIDRQLVQVNGSVSFGLPKTEMSTRTLPLASLSVDLLAFHLEQFPASDEGLIFCAPDGGRLQRNRFNEVWRKARTTAKVRPDATFHDLRHFYASLLIRRGESVKVVQARLGHASAAETLDTYSHLWPDSEEQTRSAITEEFTARKSSAA
jgi:integrase